MHDEVYYGFPIHAVSRGHEAGVHHFAHASIPVRKGAKTNDTNEPLFVVESVGVVDRF